MTVRNLEYAFNPKSVALIGASQKTGSVGNKVLLNMIEAAFQGKIWPVNPKYTEIDGVKCFKSIADLPGAPDFAVIMTPPQVVPDVVDQLGKKGGKSAIVITAGINDSNGLKQNMLDAARPYTLRLIGPNTLGFLTPAIGLNASFSHIAPKPGKLAVLSQSGAIATSLVDWAADQGIGFSKMVSLGDMADVDVGDCLDMLATDRDTSAILMYLESIPHPRKFLSAARAAAKLKPVIAIKSGRHEAAAAAAATHTGALSGADKVVDAALKRAGVLRVRTLSELFLAAETVSRFPPLRQARVGIVTNGGGAGVLAVDQLADEDGTMAELTPETFAKLDRFLPKTWSRANPVDIIGDAPPERYVDSVRAVAEDPNVDAVLVMNCPTALADPVAAAEALASQVEKGMINKKPVLACWLGEFAARRARQILHDAGIASFHTPSEASRALGFLDKWSRAQQSLSRVPDADFANAVDGRETAREIFRAVAAEGRAMLTEPEAKAVVAAYGISVPPVEVGKTPEEVGQIAAKMLEKSNTVVVKLMSRTMTHKSDVGGVVLNIGTADGAASAANSITRRVREIDENAVKEIDGFAVQPMVRMKDAHELILGMNRDPIFGPVILFGAGGTSVEVVDDTAIALPPIDDVLGRSLISRTRIGKLLKGYRDRPAVNEQVLLDTLNNLSQLVVDFPCITGIDINPLLVNHEGAMGLDARIEIDVSRVEEHGPGKELAIRPYPSKWKTEVEMSDGTKVNVRPIQPSDIGYFDDLFANTSQEDIRLRFMGTMKGLPMDALKRLTQLDYDRQMAFVGMIDDDKTLAGVSRIACDPDKETAEYGILVRSDMQGRGLGWKLLEYLIAYGKAEGIKYFEGDILRENRKMLDMCREWGFDISTHPDEPSLMKARLDLSKV